MTMDRVYNPHQQQHGFQQQATTHPSHHHHHQQQQQQLQLQAQLQQQQQQHLHQHGNNNNNHPHQHHHHHAAHLRHQRQSQQQQQQLSSSPPPLTPSSNLLQQQVSAQQLRQHSYQSNQYHQQHNLINQHHHHHINHQQHTNLTHLNNDRGRGSESSSPTAPAILHRPQHPPPPPPSLPEQQSLSINQQIQSTSQATSTNLFVPPIIASKQLLTDESRSANVLRNSLPAVPSRSIESASELVQRNSLQHNYYPDTHYQFHQPSNLKRHTHDNKYYTEQNQLLQSTRTISYQPTIEFNNTVTDLQPCDNTVFDSSQADHTIQDMCTDEVVQAILAAKDALEKPNEERDDDDIMLIDKLCSLVHGFDAFPKSICRALAAQSVLIVIDEKGKELIVHNEELDSFCVLIFGECVQLNETKTMPIRYYKVGDAFGICEPTTETQKFVGYMVTRCENCAFLCVKRDDFYTILTDPANYPNKKVIRHRDRKGNIVCVSQFNVDSESSGPLWSYHMQSKPSKIVFPYGHIISKATESCLLTALVDGYERVDPDYVEDFLLLFRVFMSWDPKDKEKKLPPGMIKLCLTLVEWLDVVEFRDRIVKIINTWLSSYYHDFELNTEFSYLFFRLLESRLLNLSMSNPLHLLYDTLTQKSKPRHVTISRSSRGDPLAFSIAGGYEKNCGIFVTQVHGSNLDESPFDSLMNYLNYPVPQVHDRTTMVGPAIPPRHKSLNNNHTLGQLDNASTRISAQLKPGDQILEVNGTNFAKIKLDEAKNKLEASTHLSLTVRYNPAAFHEMRSLPEGRRKSSMSSISSASPYPQTTQKFTFNLHEQINNKNSIDSYPPTSPLFSTNANFGLKSIVKSAQRNDPSRLLNRIANSSRQIKRQFTRQMRESNSQSGLAETASRASDNISDDQNIEPESGKIRSNPDLPSLKGKEKKIDCGLSSNTLRLDDANNAAMVEGATSDSANQTLVNVLRVFNAANNDSRYLLIHEETTAREVVMVAVKEFNLTSSNTGAQNSPSDKKMSSQDWNLYEVSVVPESRTTKQKLLSEQMTRLAERASLCSRFYIKNNSQSSIGPSKLDMGDDALVNEILKESPAHVTLSSLNAKLLAVELTLADFDKFRSIEPQQFVYDTFFDCSEKENQLASTNGSISSHDSASLKSSSSDGQDASDLLHLMNKTRSVPKSWMHEYHQFADISNREMFWVICEILNERNISRRVLIVKQFVRVADVCFQLRNYNSMFAIISGLGHSCVARLRRTFEKLKPKYKNQLEKMRSLFDPSKNMSNYRICLSQTQPAAIPLFPQIKKDLTFTKEGRSIFVREQNDLSDDDSDTCFSQGTIKRKTGGDLLAVKSSTTMNENVLEKNHHLPIAQTRSLSYSAYNNSQRAQPNNECSDSLLINFAEIRQFTQRVRSVTHFSSVPYSNDLLINTKDSQRNQAQIKKMHEEWQMRKRIRHYISQTLATKNDDEFTRQQRTNVTASDCKGLDQTDGVSISTKQSSGGKLTISYDERTLYTKSLEVEPELNSRPQVMSEARHIATAAPPSVTIQTTALQLSLPPSQVVSIFSIPQPQLQSTASNSSPTLSKSSSLSSCSSFSHHLPNHHAARGSSNFTSAVGKFGTDSTESLRKLKALSENDWRPSSCNNSNSNSNNNNNQHHGSHHNNGLTRIASDGLGGLTRNLPSLFPTKNDR